MEDEDKQGIYKMIRNIGRDLYLPNISLSESLDYKYIKSIYRYTELNNIYDSLTEDEISLLYDYKYINYSLYKLISKSRPGTSKYESSQDPEVPVFKMANEKVSNLRGFLVFKLSSLLDKYLRNYQSFIHGVYVYSHTSNEKKQQNIAHLFLLWKTLQLLRCYEGKISGLLTVPDNKTILWFGRMDRLDASNRTFDTDIFEKMKEHDKLPPDVKKRP